MFVVAAAERRVLAAVAGVVAADDVLYSMTVQENGYQWVGLSKLEY
jgi:hypothetical protein